ncbi:uncharacterized protein NECHADRAFT_92726 [Fusarium vanettenii 77-13-4]|uniref:Uncharacterized protein n=1 Tax=Fusarium vanettenii (strain ATCC MYA-4622 / CBS 123669 / FGSC 9596 / NRRL 45880 / 77-13-4) TaxID=660122 RepID=C7YQE1_FUSV7|nr:uncharacterized protein NECHADRAFT_92726 [Fusarium vanettenii 77-13-4]EEU46452.1 hypothetical protein NECHADRAFT_92726 [Fusarium vanettenii 77-13-4]
MTDAEKLEPPKVAPSEDPGARELAEESESEDQFTDAQSDAASSMLNSPVPKTRVERVDDQPSYGEVPGTPAYALREQDAQPDEIAIAPEETPSRDASVTPEINAPTTIVEEAPGPRSRSHSIQYEERRRADASPDIVVDSDGQSKEEEASEKPITVAAPVPAGDSDDDEEDDEEEDGGEDDFGDDFDDFEEGNEDDDFDDFEDGFQQAETPAPAPSQATIPQQPTLPFPIPDFDGLDPEGVIATLEPYLAALFPPEELDLPAFPSLSKDSSVFFTPRSASLWSQLVAPPPLAPPDWIRSRTRRLFLVSLGVPVDLDEILPASKQKKLVLPSLNVRTASPRNSSESRSVSRLRQGEGNNSSTSVDTQGKPSASKKRRGPPPQPELDLVAARHLCMTTDEALNGMTDQELKAHIAKLQGLEGAAKEALEYWQKRTDEKIGDREAFEGVIENLVKHARKVRK